MSHGDISGPCVNLLILAPELRGTVPLRNIISPVSNVGPIFGMGHGYSHSVISSTCKPIICLHVSSLGLPQLMIGLSQRTDS